MRDLPFIILVVLFLIVEAGYFTHKWHTVSQEYARLRKAHTIFATLMLGLIFGLLVAHLGFGWANAPSAQLPIRCCDKV